MPLRSRLDTMVLAATAPAPLLPVEPAPAVILLSSQPEVVVPEGLFPHDLLTCKVLAPCTLSRTGFCIRPLVDHELWALWDVPILLQDLALPGTEQALALSAVAGSAPVKVLTAGAECLLSGFYGGVPRPSVWDVELD